MRDDRHYHLRSVPEKCRDATRQWTEAHNLFSGVPTAGYDEAALV